MKEKVAVWGVELGWLGMGLSLEKLFGFLNYVMFYCGKYENLLLRDLAAILKILIRSGYVKIRKLYHNYVKHIESKCKMDIRAQGFFYFPHFLLL